MKTSLDRTDSDAIAGDWRAVGNDLRQAMDGFARDLRRAEQAGLPLQGADWQGALDTIAAQRVAEEARAQERACLLAWLLWGSALLVLAFLVIYLPEFRGEILKFVAVFGAGIAAGVVLRRR